MPAILDLHGNPMADESKSVSRKRVMQRALRARYDAAQTTVENEAHWAATDALSVNAANTPGIRQKLRDRSRYEYANNSYYKGMILTRGQYLIATGPHLRISFESNRNGGDAKIGQEIQNKWEDWSDKIGLTEKLTSAITAETVDGEAFMIEVNNRHLEADEVQLDYRVYEAEQIANPYFAVQDPQYVDGIRLDNAGYPISYDMMKYHPGEVYFGLGGNFIFGNNVKRVPAGRVLHFFRVDRPGQARGVPWITPALPMFAQFRRFTLATLTAAEAAANAAGVIYTDSAALMADDIEMPDEDKFDLPRGSFPVMPAGWKMEQVNPEHPATTFEMFRRGIMSEIARCLVMPLNIAIANSENYNYASGRLDHQVFHRGIAVERKWIETNVLRRIFAKWYDEALMVPGYLPSGVTSMGLKATWYWDGMPHVDPNKEAQATIALWEAGLISDEDYWFNTLGVDPGKQYEKLRNQQAAREEIGLPIPGGALEPAQTEDQDAV